jgi:UDPglucose 6-dehydrogenase
VGIGYVGLVTAAVFAKLGNQVWGLDIDKEKIKTLKAKKIPFFEPGLKELVVREIEKKHLHFTTSYQEAIPQSEIVIICVGTPPKINGDYDLNFVFSAAKKIAQAINKYTVIVIKSTVPPSTGKKVKEIIKKLTRFPFDIASCPEFLREGSAVWDSFHPSRIVIGTDNKKAETLLLKLHRLLKAPRVTCDIASAQLIKYAANAFLATKISYINAIAIICDKVGANILKVQEGLGLDPRIGQSFLNAGLGYGGSCFPKDTWALISFAKRQGYDFTFLKQVDQINKDQIGYYINKTEKLLGGDLKNKTITILGLAFKPDTDDLREARSLAIIRHLQEKGAYVQATDPAAISNAGKIIKNVQFFSNVYEALKDSDALLLVTEWSDYRKLNFMKIKKIMKKPVIIDGRNILPAEKLKRLGFIYEGIGRH